jgi:hypothetical protein
LNSIHQFFGILSINICKCLFVQIFLPDYVVFLLQFIVFNFFYKNIYFAVYVYSFIFSHIAGASIVSQVDALLKLKDNYLLASIFNSYKNNPPRKSSPLPTQYSLIISPKKTCHMMCTKKKLSKVQDIKEDIEKWSFEDYGNIYVCMCGILKALLALSHFHLSALHLYSCTSKF